jgi:hypothetical protein
VGDGEDPVGSREGREVRTLHFQHEKMWRLLSVEISSVSGPFRTGFQQTTGWRNTMGCLGSGWGLVSYRQIPHPYHYY